MQTPSPRTLLAMSAALALTAAALAPTAAFAKGPGPGAGGCDAECTNDQTPAQHQVRAQDGTGDQAQAPTRARDGSAQQIGTQANAARDQGGRNQGDNQGAGRGPNDDKPQGPGNCEDCDIEMGTLSPEDKAGLIYMVEEEKLAHDVYVEFAKLYDLRAFEQIAMSEARHQAAVRTVLDRYDITDPTADLGEGEFIDSGLQQQYIDLVAQGSVSLEDALAAAITIEKQDILDLKETMAALGDAPDVLNMYSHLLTASGYHQTAFESWL